MLAGNLTGDEDKTRLLQQKTSEFNSSLNGFPVSTNILVVDTDLISVLDMKKVIKQCAYQVTIYTQAEEAIAFLTNCKHEINIVIWDFNMPGINGLQALELIGSKLGLPVVIMADDDPVESVMQATIHGACDYLVKPISHSIIANIWQHIVRKRMIMMPKPGLLPPVQSEDKGEQNIDEIEENAAKKPRMASPCEETQPLQSDPVPSNGLDKDNDNSMTINQCNGEENMVEQKPRKARMMWDKDLQEKFLKAIDIAGGAEKANPKSLLKYLQEMKVEGLTRSNVASHLQKYRMGLDEDKAPQPMVETGWSPLSLNNIFTTGSSLVINGDPAQQNHYRNYVFPRGSSLMLNGDPVQQNQYCNYVHSTTSSLMNGGTVQQNQYLNNVHTATSSLTNGGTVQQNQYLNNVHTATTSLMNGGTVQQNQYLNNVHTATSSLMSGGTVQQNQYLNNVHTATSSLMNGDTVQQNQYVNNVHTTTSSLLNGDPIQHSQYRNGYSTMNNNNNQFMTSPLPRLPYLDHPHLQQQQQQKHPQQQHDQQLPLSHEWNYVTSNNEPEQAFSITEPELIYTSLPYDLGESLLNGYNFTQ